MSFQTSRPLSAPTLNRLKSAHAIKEMLRNSLNFDRTSPEPEVMSFPLPRSDLPPDDATDPWLFEDENVEEYGSGYTRSRCDSGASVATIRGAENPTACQVSGSKKKTSYKHRASPTKRKGSLKRCHASRNLRLGYDVGHNDDHNDGDPNDPDGDGLSHPQGDDLNLQEDGLKSSVSSGKPVNRLSASEFNEILDLIADEEEAGNGLLNKIADSVFGSLRLHERFEVSVKMKTRHVVMWDVNLDHAYALEGLVYVKDAKPQTADSPLKPIDSMTIDWCTVDSCGRAPRITDDTIYSTSFRGRASLLTRPQVVGHLDPANGIHTDISWTWIAPCYPGTGPGGGWALRFWVPIPMWIFNGRDVARSLVRASIVFHDGTDCMWTAYSNTANVTIEHLRRGRDMRVSGRR